MITPEQRAEFESWATAQGLIRTSHGIRSGNSAVPAYWEVWKAAQAPLISALEEAETAYETTYEVWQRTELENQLLRKQLAEARAILKTREQSYVGVVADHCDRILWRGHYYSISSILAINTAIAEAVDNEKQNPWKREILNALLVNHIYTASQDNAPLIGLS